MATRRNVCCSISMGKDSLAMLLMLVERGCRVDEVVFYNSGVEFKAIYNTRDKLIPMLDKWGIKFTELYSRNPFLWSMLERPVCERGTDIVHKTGYSWCGGTCRWGTSEKLNAIKKYIGNHWDMVLCKIGCSTT